MLSRFFVAMLLLLAGQLALSQEDPANSPDVTVHVVQRGETVFSIARQHNSTIEAIATLNGLTNPNSIAIGQRLIVPVTAQSIQTITLVPQTAESIHIVQPNETLFRIALRYGSTVAQLSELNSLADPTLIFAGQRLLIPSTETAQAESYPAPITKIVLKPAIFTEGSTGSITLETQTAVTLQGEFLGKPLNIITGNNAYASIIGIPLFTEAGTYTAQLILEQPNQSPLRVNLPITVVSGGYAATNINITPEQEALLAPAVEEFEISTITRVTSQFSSERLFEGTLSLPAAAPMNAPYGTRRSYNGGALNRVHNGADFASPPNTPIFAAAKGRVVLADTLNIRGNTVVLYHGLGVYTLYAHLNSINVALGQEVTSGQVIGVSGATGRATGPHLHWEVWVNGIAVNPIQWTQQYFP